MDDDERRAMRLLGEQYFGNEVYGEYLPFFHALQEQCDAMKLRANVAGKIATIDNLLDAADKNEKDCLTVENIMDYQRGQLRRAKVVVPNVVYKSNYIQ